MWRAGAEAVDIRVLSLPQRDGGTAVVDRVLPPLAAIAVGSGEDERHRPKNGLNEPYVGIFFVVF